MASLQEQEADLETQIETYKSQVRDCWCMYVCEGDYVVCCGVQLSLVKASESGAGQGEIGQLVQDLQQLIELSERMFIPSLCLNIESLPLS